MIKRDNYNHKKQEHQVKYPDEKIRIVLEALRGEIPTSDICRREGIAVSMYYKWSKAFLHAGKNGLTKDTLRDATSDEVKSLKSENHQLETLRHILKRRLDVMFRLKLTIFIEVLIPQ